MKAGFTWIVVVAHCCGRRYKRARLEGRKFPASHTHCVHCLRPLVWSKFNRQAYRNAKTRAQRAEWVRQGLTTKGKPRVHPVRPELAGLHGQERVNARSRLRTRERALQGLTARGKRRKLMRTHLTAPAILFEQLKAELASAPRELPIATGFRDMELNQRFAEAGRANKGNFNQFKLKEAA